MEATLLVGMLVIALFGVVLVCAALAWVVDETGIRNVGAEQPGVLAHRGLGRANEA